VCNGTNGALVDGITTFQQGAAGQSLSTRPYYFARNDIGAEHGGTVFYIIKDGVYQFSSSVALNTAGLNHWRGIGIRVTEPDGVTEILHNPTSFWPYHTTGVEGFGMNSSYTAPLLAGTKVRVILLADDPTQALPDDRGIKSQCTVMILS
jgi:hypothetical protein